MPSLVIGNTGAFIGDAKVGSRFEFLTSLINSGLDSAQAEGTGWDAIVKGNIPGASIVATSRTVITITLPAFASYNITAQETITAKALAGLIQGYLSDVTGSPTFTIDTGGGSPPPSFIPFRTALMGVGF